MSRDKVTNVVFAGLGGTGVIKASDILAHAAYLEGYDVKKAEVHGMSQRGGSVRSEVRFGRRVFSPMPPAGEVEYLVLLEASQLDNNRHLLAPGGLLFAPEAMELPEGSDGLAIAQPGGKAHNVTMLGRLSVYLPLKADSWAQAIEASFPARLLDVNRKAFQVGAAHERARYGDRAAGVP